VHDLGNTAVRDQYEAAGFAGRVGWGERPAVLVIDMAKAWADPSEMLGSDLSPVLAAILRVLDSARGVELPIFFTTMAYDPELVEVGHVVQAKTPHSRLMIRGSERVQLLDALERRPNEPLIEKPRASAFFGTNLLSTLISERVDTVVVVGCSTSGCIRSTCESAFNNNLRAIVPREAVGDRSATAHGPALFDIDARFGDVVELEDVLAHLDALAPAG
jgi:nicotinamidase-related amidase